MQRQFVKISGKLLKVYNISNIKCDSVALYNYHIGNSPDKRAINVAKKYNIDISNLRARKINNNDE